MDKAKELLTYDSLAFFGKVSASISHELKNIMAIISETAGLLGDLADLASTGNPLQPDVLKNSVASIEEEIQRGFATIRHMNRFAHSVDVPTQTVSLPEMAELVGNLAAFLSFAGKVRISSAEGAGAQVSTCPFLLQTVFYQALVHAYRSAGPGAPVEVSIRAQGETGWRVNFSWAAVKATAPFPDEATAHAAAMVGVAIDVDETAGRLELTVPQQIEIAGA